MIEIKSAQYISSDDGEPNTIRATIDGILSFVPISDGNATYAEIMRQVKDGTLTIADAE